MLYRRITDSDRGTIWVLLHQGLNKTQISNRLGFHKSTISREIKRNGYKNGGYYFVNANLFAWRRQAHRRRPKKMCDDLINKIISLLELKWSPEQISNRLKKEGRLSVCAETIYKFIYKNRRYGGFLYEHLRRGHVKRRKRFPGRRERKFQYTLPSIEKRPVRVNQRLRIGDWERDTMQGGSRKENILVAVERKSKFIKIAKLRSKSSKVTARATNNLLRSMITKTITNDRGVEFVEYKTVEKKLKVKVYFCRPYCSYERGTNENSIGLLRQYIPKGKTIRFLNHKKIKSIEKEINFRPRKTLDWLTPYEYYYKKSVALCS